MRCKKCEKSACDSCGHCSCGWSYWDNGWINLSKRMPDPFVWVLGYTDDGAIYKICRSGYKVRGSDENNQNSFDKKEWVFPWYIRENSVFTHWMPLPQPPEEQ